MDFRKKVLTKINVPVGRIVFTKDKWGVLAKVYFNGITKPVCISDENYKNDDEFEIFIHYVKRASEKMICEAKKCFGENWRNFIKTRG